MGPSLDCPHYTKRRYKHSHFFKVVWESLTKLHSLYLLIGYVRQNSGLAYPCAVCCRAFSRSRVPFQCTLYQVWLSVSYLSHKTLQYCSCLSHAKQYTPGWICLSFRPTAQFCNSRVSYPLLQTSRPSQSTTELLLFHFSSTHQNVAGALKVTKIGIALPFPR